MFARLQRHKTLFRWSSPEQQTNSANLAPFVDPVSGVTVDPTCNLTITLTCLRQLYNAVGYTPSAKVGNSIGITGYLEQFANIQDLQSFYADQLPEALNTSFEFISVKGLHCLPAMFISSNTFLPAGGINPQNLSDVTPEPLFMVIRITHFLATRPEPRRT